ncbi:hypothetical protein [Nonomuraea sp. NPDC050643]|uniref:hypothetical protein n=1 Tax=Nonomuraea sp. NPDC050643 TaxID=3155660 RepID=UPI00341072FE
MPLPGMFPGSRLGHVLVARPLPGGADVAERAGGEVKEVHGASHVMMMSRPDTVVRQILAAHTATR